jgi:hypothetical protein
MQINGIVNEWETVAVPLVNGVDLNTRARLVEPTKLLSAKNCYFPRSGGLEKRKGHTSETVEYGTVAPYPGSSASHIYGFGWVDAENAHNSVNGASSYPYAGDLLGIAKRDSESVVWDGSKLYGEGAPIKAYMPTAVSSPIAKTAVSHNYTDIGDNGTIRVVATRDLSAGNVRVFVYNSETGALKFESTAGGSDPEFLYVVPFGNYVHIFIQDITDQVIYHYTLNNDSISLPASQSLGVNVGAHFDVQTWVGQVGTGDPNRLVLVYIDTSQDVRIMYLNDNGTIDDLLLAANTQLNCGGANVLRVAVAVRPTSQVVGLLWGQTGNGQRARLFGAEGTPISPVVTVSNYADNQKVAITSNYVLEFPPADSSIFYTYVDKTTAGDRCIEMRRFDSTGTITTVATRYNVNLVSHAFRVGNVPFVWACYPSDFQTTYLLLDERLYPCGKMEYGTAVNNTTDPWLFSCNADYSNPRPTEFHCALMYKQRVLEQDGVFHEVGTKFCTLNFLPEFRRAQAGRSLYFPGAQLWSYDGKSLTEQGFHFTPEDPVMQGSNGAGSLTLTGRYQYRIYPCWKNAQGEEVRGPAILTSEIVLGDAGTGGPAGSDTVTIDINTIPTCRTDAYFLVYRNVNAGTVWYLCSERDPVSSNCPKNTLTVDTVQFVDTVSDATLLTRELDPANSVGYLHSFSAPACEVIAYGNNRLWVAGGELTKGTILPSRLAYENEGFAFHGNLAYSIDRGATPITAVGFLVDYIVAFKEDRGFIITGDAADNTSQGDSLRTQRALSDVGCVSHNSLVELTSGLTFQSEGGIRLLSASGSVVNIGTDVDPAVTYVTDAVLDTENRLVKFYQSDADTLVFDYESGQWTTWTVRTDSAIPGKLVNDYSIWTEADVYTDADANYLHSWRSANLGPVLGGLHRVRRAGALGESDQNYVITARSYLDDSANWNEEWTWDSSDDLETSTWGSGTWGSGFWGGSSTTTLYPKDNIWRWRHRLSKQKCSCISVEVEYNGPDKGPVHTALLLEIGRKTGLDRQLKGS